MRRRSLSFAICCLTFSLAAAAHAAMAAKEPSPAKPATQAINPDGEPPGPAERPLCVSICSTGTPCDSCRANGVFTTCGQYAGHPANDLDGDGVVDTNDNCQCLANADQRDCDGDHFGDACDFQDNSWRRISIGTQRCYLDTDNHFLTTTLEFYYQDVYQSSCTGQSCYKKYLKGTVDCSTGSNYVQCCQSKWSWFPDCGGAWNIDNCGLPRCSF